MSDLLQRVNQRTQLVGQNRLELLLFHLTEAQQYGINVFKVKEVIRRSTLNLIPQRHPAMKGVVLVRGVTIPLIDLHFAIGGSPLGTADQNFIIITEYNQSVQGFLVKSLEKIINIQWDTVHAPPPGLSTSYLTAVTQVAGQLIEIIDVEKILQEIAPAKIQISEQQRDQSSALKLDPYAVLVVDDSSVARSQVQQTLKTLGLEVISKKNGQEALQFLKQLANDPHADTQSLFKKLRLLISDVEMPEMDGYTLVTAIRNDPQLKHLYTILHTSLSGGFNSSLVEKVGANQFLPKFKATDLANAVLDYFSKLKSCPQ